MRGVLHNHQKLRGFIMPAVLFISLALSVIGIALLDYASAVRMSLFKNLDSRIARDAAQSGFEYGRDLLEGNAAYAGTDAPVNCSNANPALAPYVMQSARFCATFKIEILQSPSSGASKLIRSTGYVYRKLGSAVALSAKQIQVGNIGGPSYTETYPIDEYNPNFWGIASGADGNLWLTEYAGGKIGRLNASSLAYFIDGLPQTRTLNAGPSGMAPGPNNTMWYTLRSINKVVSMSVSAPYNYTEYTLPTASSSPLAIAKGQDNNMWVTGYNSNKITRITPAGAFFELTPVISQPADIVAGPSDFTMWYVSQNTNEVGYLNAPSSGNPTLGNKRTVPTAASQPRSITLGNDNALWFTEQTGAKIGRATRSGSTITITEYSNGMPAGSQPYTIATGTGNFVWFTIVNTGKIGRLNTSTGVITTYGVSGASYITKGPDGNMWFTNGGNQVGKIVDSGGVVTITEYKIGYKTWPFGITKGPDGNMWFPQYLSGTLGKATSSGAITPYALTKANMLPKDIAVVDSNMWFTSTVDDTFYKATLNGANPPTLTAYNPWGATNTVFPIGLTKGPDGNIWFAESVANKIGKINTSGVLVAEASLAAGANPRCVRPGTGNVLWFSEQGTNKMGKITTSMAVTEYTAPTPGRAPFCTVLGPDGNMWFTEIGAIAKITPAGAITEYPLSENDAAAKYIVLGPDGNMWFTILNKNKIGSISIGGKIREYAVPAGSTPLSLAVGPDNEIWFTNLDGTYIGRLIIQNPAIVFNKQTQLAIYRAGKEGFEGVS